MRPEWARWTWGSGGNSYKGEQLFKEMKMI